MIVSKQENEQYILSKFLLSLKTYPTECKITNTITDIAYFPNGKCSNVTTYKKNHFRLLTIIENVAI